MQNRLQKPVVKLSVTAVLIALSTALSLFAITLPFGGEITVLSMLPVCMISIMYGTGWAILPCFVYATIQLYIGLTRGVFAYVVSPEMTVGVVWFDYFFAFAFLCLAGVFRKKGVIGIVCGVALACFIRFVCHVVSGCIFWASLSDKLELFDNDFTSQPLVYSLLYNGLYMLPELVITTLGAFLVFGSKSVRKVLICDIAPAKKADEAALSTETEKPAESTEAK